APGSAASELPPGCPAASVPIWRPSNNAIRWAPPRPAGISRSPPLPPPSTADFSVGAFVSGAVYYRKYVRIGRCRRGGSDRRDRPVGAGEIGGWGDAGPNDV